MKKQIFITFFLITLFSVVDFIAAKNNQPLYIQVAYLLADNKTIEREFGALEKINDNHPKIVLSLDKFPENNRNGIQWHNLIDFLTSSQQTGNGTIFRTQIKS